MTEISWVLVLQSLAAIISVVAVVLSFRELRRKQDADFKLRIEIEKEMRRQVYLRDLADCLAYNPSDKEMIDKGEKVIEWIVQKRLQEEPNVKHQIEEALHRSSQEGKANYIVKVFTEHQGLTIAD